MGQGLEALVGPCRGEVKSGGAEGAEEEADGGADGRGWEVGQRWGWRSGRQKLSSDSLREESQRYRDTEPLNRWQKDISEIHL